jgi:hypothetical protein
VARLPSSIRYASTRVSDSHVTVTVSLAPWYRAWLLLKAIASIRVG